VDGTQPCTLLDPPENDSQANSTHAGDQIDRDYRLPVIFRHTGWHRVRCLVADSLYRTGQTAARRSNFWDCGSHAYVLQSEDDPTRFRVAGSNCRDRFCLPCARERSRVITGNILTYIDGKEVRFLTLTVKNDGLDLADTLHKLYQSFAKLRRRRKFARRVWGGVAFLELKWSTRGERWHPHLHCLISGTWIDKREVSTMWRQATGDSYIIDIQRPKTSEDVARYVTKYASKPFNNTFANRPRLLDEAIAAMAGRKLCLTWGTWRGLKLTDTHLESGWTHYDTLQSVLHRAMNGEVVAQQIVKSLTGKSVDVVMSRAPPPAIHREPAAAPIWTQATFPECAETATTKFIAGY